MFSEGEILMQNNNEVIEMLPEEKYSEVLKSAETQPKRENAGAVIDQLVMFFDGKTYKSGNFLMMEQE